MIEEILREVDMRLAGIEAGIEMGERHRYEPPCPEHRRGFDDELHCQLQRRAFGAVEPLLIAPVEFEIAHE